MDGKSEIRYVVRHSGKHQLERLGHWNVNVFVSVQVFVRQWSLILTLHYGVSGAALAHAVECVT